jgi:biopolymer transport protein ExbB
MICRKALVRSVISGKKNDRRFVIELRTFKERVQGVFELVKAGGWMMLPIILSSIIGMAIVAERLWTLRRTRVVPPQLLAQVWKWLQDNSLTSEKLKELRANSPLGEVMAAGLANSRHGREVMKEAIEEAGSRIVHDLERYLNTLGTIAAMAPLMGLLGTVFGMIEIFSSFMESGLANAPVLAGGISKALLTTAAGLIVAIPAVFFHRFLLRRVDELIVSMEQESIKLVEVVQGDREVDFVTEGTKA